jgi:hypothetical protein
MARLLNGTRRVDLSRVRADRIRPLLTARSLPLPTEPLASALRDRLLDALQVRDGSSALDLLLRAAWEVEPAEQPLAAWLPTLVALEELADQGAPLDRDGRLRDFIANTIRAQLAHAVPCSEPIWVIPATPADAAAAWLLAAVSSQRGRTARPWLWPQQPPRGRAFFTVGRRFLASRFNMPDCKGHYGLVRAESGLGIATLLGDTRSRERAKTISDRARKWRRDPLTP